MRQPPSRPPRGPPLPAGPNPPHGLSAWPPRWLRPAAVARAGRGGPGRGGPRARAPGGGPGDARGVDSLSETIAAAGGGVPLVAAGPLTNTARGARPPPPLAAQVADF